MIRLTAVIELDGQGRRALTHESNARTIVLGRDAGADFQIPLTTVSRAHAKISETDNVYVIEDLGSTHGTMLNGRLLAEGEKRVLRDGDVVELTRAKVTCNIDEDKVALSDVNENTQAIAAKAVQGILGRLGDTDGEGPFLRIIVGAEEGKRFVLSPSASEWRLGRSKDCECMINDPNVSRKHALVKKDWHGFTIADLGSKNGVIVNDRQISKPRRLKDRDEIVIGPVKLLFIDPDAELMAALADVPGFEIDTHDEEELDAEPSVIGAPLDTMDEEASLATGEAEQPEPLAEKEEEDSYADIDPELLAGAQGKFPTEWLIIASVSLLIVGGVLLLFMIL